MLSELPSSLRAEVVR